MFAGMKKARESSAKSSLFKHGPHLNIVESIVVQMSSLLGFSSTYVGRVLQLHLQSSSNMIYGLLNSPLFLMGAAGRKQIMKPVLLLYFLFFLLPGNEVMTPVCY